MRVAIVGGGIAGALLAWRLTAHPRPVTVEVFLGDRPPSADATGASGGLVRGYEPDPQARLLATASLSELRGSATLRAWSDYREIGSLYLTADDPTDALEQIGHALPGSAVAATVAQLAGRSPFRGLPPGTVGVVERHAGYVSPARLRDGVLARIADAGAAVHDHVVDGVTTAPAVRLAGDAQRRFDAVVVAAGAWSARLLAAAGADTGTLRTRRIQYDVRRGCPPGLGAFVDETSGLYGRPFGDDALLLGLPSQDWDVDPQAVVPDPGLAGRVALAARSRLGTATGRPVRTVASFDCYAGAPGLALRPAAPATLLFSFTGGSGGAVKTALAASRAAADSLLQLSPAA